MDGLKEARSESLTARRCRLKVTVNGQDATDAIRPDALEWEYTDYASKADEFRLTLADPEGRWSGPWKPEKGMRVSARLECYDWTEPGELLELPLGEFVVDETELSGPPDKVTVKAVSAAKSGAIAETETTRGWENFTLEGVAREIASGHGLELLYEAAAFTFGRLDQREETDLSFLHRVGADCGVNVKAHSGKLVLFSAQAADAKAPSLTIAKKAGQFSPSSYSFTEKTEGTAKEAHVAYHDPEANETYTATVTATVTHPEAAADPSGGKPPSEHLIKLNERVENTQQAIQLATSALRAKNGNELTCDITVMGHPGIVAGVTVSLTGFGAYDGKFFVESATHKGPPYTTDASLRKTLNY